MTEEIKIDIPTVGSSGRGTTRCYRVQAKVMSGGEPIVIIAGGVSVGFKDTLTDSRWSDLVFTQSAHGVPAGRPYDEFARHGYLSYPAAQALRWWFIAEQRGPILTRLVEYEFKHSYEATPVGVHCLVDPRKREDITPAGVKNETNEN